VVGPTGIGKSQLAFDLALELGGEIVVADSRQVYQRLDIATNKPSPEQRRQVRYHMIDFVDPAANFNASQYVEGARKAIADIESRDNLPIVEGGTMLYVDALSDGFSLTGIPPNPELRAQLERLDAASLRERLLALDPDPGVDLHNPVRIGLTADLEVIDKRLGERSRRQVERGLVEETRAALDAGVPESAYVLTGIGYAETLAHIHGRLTLEELPLAMAQSNRRYARRQLRWWTRDKRVAWFDIEPDPLPGILNYVRNAIE
jgi:tRNA dimethylallyltransferase